MVLQKYEVDVLLFGIDISYSSTVSQMINVNRLIFKITITPMSYKPIIIDL